MMAEGIPHDHIGIVDRAIVDSKGATAIPMLANTKRASILPHLHELREGDRTPKPETSHLKYSLRRCDS
jgi:hypothetical protein